VPHKLKIKGMFKKGETDAEEEAAELMPRSSEGAKSGADEDSYGSKEERKSAGRVPARKVLDADISKSDRKMRAALESYLSVSESDGEDKDLKNRPRLARKGNAQQAKEQSSSEERRQIAQVSYAGMISHSESSDEDSKEEHNPCRGGANLRDRDDKAENDDPDFMASDDPPDGFQ